MLETIDSTVASWDARHATLAVGIGLTAWAAATDLTRMRIPNHLVAGLTVAGALYVIAAGLPPLAHVLTFIAMLVAGFGAYALNLFGAGDAKLLAALSLWFGPFGALGMVLVTALLGAGLALIWIGSRPARLALISVGLPIDPEPTKHIPYGVAIAGAAMIAFIGQWP